jgi:hypothetical protein
MTEREQGSSEREGESSRIDELERKLEAERGRRRTLEREVSELERLLDEEGTSGTGNKRSGSLPGSVGGTTGTGESD